MKNYARGLTTTATVPVLIKMSSWALKNLTSSATYTAGFEKAGLYPITEPEPTFDSERQALGRASQHRVSLRARQNAAWDRLVEIVKGPRTSLTTKIDEIADLFFPLTSRSVLFQAQRARRLSEPTPKEIRTEFGAHDLKGVSPGES